MAKCIKIEDSAKGYPLDLFCIPNHYIEDIESVLIPAGIISDRIEKLACDIVAAYSGQNDSTTSPPRLTVICVLKGGYKFFSELLDRISQMHRIAAVTCTQSLSLLLRVEFVRCRSYMNDASSGRVELVGLSNMDSIRGQDVLIVEDIIDTGITMRKLLAELQNFSPRSLKVAALIVKRDVQTGPDQYQPDYAAFSVPRRFLVGYALDYNEYFRDLNHICVVNENGIKKYRANSKASTPTPSMATTPTSAPSTNGINGLHIPLPVSSL